MTALLFAFAMVTLLVGCVGAGLVFVVRLEGADLRSLRRHQRVWRTWERWSEPVDDPTEERLLGRREVV